MFNVRATNINDAYFKGFMVLAQTGQRRSSRNGPVLVAPEPVTTHYINPTHRVLFDENRDANPFFHLFEALWMLDGRNDVDTLIYLLPRMAEFSDDGKTFHGAYGHRWRRHFGFDQLPRIVEILHKDPDSRRAVMSIWDANEDLGTESKDLPCNDMVMFGRGDSGELNMSVLNRSNDMILGAYGANAVHFSVMQEYVASRLGARCGWYEQVSFNFHAYIEQFERHQAHVLNARMTSNPYTEIGESHVMTVPLMTDPLLWDAENRFLMENLATPNKFIARGFSNDFFEDVCAPMALAFRNYRNDTLEGSEIILRKAIEAAGPVDWLIAGYQWIQRRIEYRARRMG